jgi:3-oxoacyl-(acyl-carrier-protein) synthase
MGVYISGIGVLSSIGANVVENLHSLSTGKSGIAPVRFLKYNAPLLTGEVKFTNQQLIEMGDVRKAPISRTSLLGLVAAREAWGSNQHDPSIRTGIIGSTSVGGMDLTEDFYDELLNGGSPNYEVLRCHDSGTTTERIAKEMGISGYVNTLSTACSSGANAIMLGARMILQGKLDRVLVGGSDALSRFTIKGFGSLMIYDSQWCRPFDESRSGLNLGEAAGFLLLEGEKSLSKTGNRPLCKLSGWHNAADAYHQTASSPDGKGATIAVSNAIAQAGLSPVDISYVNAHGTGTQNNDLSESVALINVFGDGKVPKFSSTKPFTGHTLAAAGAIEAVYSVLAIQQGLIYPNLNYSNPISGPGLVPVTEFQTGQAVNAVLSNSFGFGGNNSSLVFSKL